MQKRNLIYMCVFHKESYINLLKLLITSIEVRGNINRETTDILIFTSPSFQPLIQKELANINLPLHYKLLDLHTLMEASCCKLQVFNYEKIDIYEKILYLDTDVLINSDINILFAINISSDKLHALEEGHIGHVFWGGQFFDFNIFDRSRPAFSAGVFYFMNSIMMKKLFTDVNSQIIDYMNKKQEVPFCLDQPFLVFNSFIQNKFDNQMMKRYLENNPKDLNSEKIIYHFPGTPGLYEPKYNRITSFWNKIVYSLADEILKKRFSMVSRERLINLYSQCKKFINTPYSFVECGVAKGGCLAMMKSIAGVNNRIYGFDSFEGMPDITNEDLGDYNRSNPLSGFGKVGDNLSGGIHTVYKTFQQLNLNMANVNLIKGFFKDTLIKQNIDILGEIAVLRLDGDWYESTKICLEKLYDKVVVGGIIIIDDYGHWIGAKRATDEFRVKHNIKSPLIQADYTEHYWIKTEPLKNKILVIMSDNRKLTKEYNSNNYWSYAAYINKNYCDKFGYDFKYIHPYYKENTNNMNSCIDLNTYELRHSSWSKLLIVLDNLNKKYEYIVYIDSDCIFRNFNISLEVKIQQYKDSSLIFQSAYPWYPELPCVGFFICKNTMENIHFLNKWYTYKMPSYDSLEWQNTLNMTKKTYSYDWQPGKHWEQDALWTLIANNMYKATVDTSEVALSEKKNQYLRHVCRVESGIRSNYFITIIQDMIKDKFPSYTDIIESIQQVELDTFEMFSIFDTRNEMLQYYCNKISNSRVLEIGVFKGDFLEHLITNCRIGSVDAVDLFEGTTCSGDADGNNVVWYDVAKSYVELSEKYKDTPNIRIHKSDSSSFLKLQADNLYDIIYIDGDHSYGGVKKDLIHSYDKIKNGGYIMGHDYQMNMKKATRTYDFGVKRAVDEFCETFKQTIVAKAMDGCVSYCIKVTKVKSS